MIRSNRSNYSDKNKRRGVEYFERGQIWTQIPFSSEYLARVGPGRKLCQLVEGESKCVEPSLCDCPTFWAEGQCGHLWALLLYTWRAFLERNDPRHDAQLRLIQRLAGTDAWLERCSSNGGVATRVPKVWRQHVDQVRFRFHWNQRSRWPRSETGECRVLFELGPVESRHERKNREQKGSALRKDEIPMITVMEQRRNANGWGSATPLLLRSRFVGDVIGGVDLERVQRLSPFFDPQHREYLWESFGHVDRRYLPGALRGPMDGPAGVCAIRDLAMEKVLFFRGDDPEQLLQWERRPWKFQMEFVAITEAAAPGTDEDPADEPPSRYGHFRLQGFFVRSHPSESADENSVGSDEQQRLELDDVRLVTPGGLLVCHHQVGEYRPLADWSWIVTALSSPPIEARALPACVEHIFATDPLAPLLLRDDPTQDRISSDTPPLPLRVTPFPYLKITSDSDDPHTPFQCEVFFNYDGSTIAASDPKNVLQRYTYCDRDTPVRTTLVRDPVAEQRLFSQLFAAGAKRSVKASEVDGILIPRNKVKLLLEELLRNGWEVDLNGMLHRPARKMQNRVASGIDWFDLNTEVEFDEETVPLPRLLQAIEQGKNSVPLRDGTLGVVPEEWLRQIEVLVGLGKLPVDKERLQFETHQVRLLEALLECMPNVSTDAEFQRLHQQVSAFESLQGLDPAHSFRGELREYQRRGLDWFRFLRQLGQGGCLADDMGLGKTVQVLAHVDRLRESGELKRPCLVVAPRSVIDHWKLEAARFAPQLRLLDFSQPNRRALKDRMADAHLVLSTYHIMREEVLSLASQRFDTIILDESQAIKNPLTATSRAAKVLDGDHRLALSGTPIENRMEELWSLFEFLQPGLLGKRHTFLELTRVRLREMKSQQEPETIVPRDQPSDRNNATSPDGLDPNLVQQIDTGLAAIAEVVRPFVLRRTKKEVAPELPDRSEQILWCDLGVEQRRAYDELHRYYQTLVDKIPRDMSQLLVGLLRLRQVACHLALLDPRRRSAEIASPSAKLDAIIPLILELREQGHRCLVFSQFTRFLRLLRDALDERAIEYEYLDGKTSDRQGRVDRFQRTPTITAFLISLKAGGVGLNLTGADYVFLLDPWWNPAVEAQAIDRAHRIGQTRKVMAYRLIARNTVEEKLLLLQEAKRCVAQQVIPEEGISGQLTQDDLRFLLGAKACDE